MEWKQDKTKLSNLQGFIVFIIKSILDIIYYIQSV